MSSGTVNGLAVHLQYHLKTQSDSLSFSKRPDRKWFPIPPNSCISQQVVIKLANTYKSQLPLGSALSYYYDVPHQHQPSLLPAQHSTLHPQPTYPCRMASPNGLICFTNCLLPCEDGSLVEKDLWIDERRGIVLDSQVRVKSPVLYPR